MDKYQVPLDVSETWEENDIEVITVTAKGNTPEEAYQNACTDLENGKHKDELDGREYYVWSVSDKDKLDEDA